MPEKELSRQGFAKYASTKLMRALARIARQFFWLEKKKFEKEQVKKILFIQLYGIGDYLMSTPAIKAVCQKFPNAEKAVYCKPASREIAELNPFIQKVFTKKPEESFDLVVSLNDSAESSFITHELRPKFAIGFLKGRKISANFKTEGLEAMENSPWVENYLLIARALRAKINGLDYVIRLEKEKRIAQLLEKRKIRNFIVLNPNTREGAEAKNWGNENYARLAEMLLKKGFWIVFSGAEGEKNSSETISLLKEKNRVVDLTGITSLKEAAFLFSKAKAFIGNDTGLMHIALAVKCPTIGIFGPTNSKILFPKAKNSFAFQVSNGKWPCYINGTFDIKPNQEFMDLIQPDAIFKKTLGLIK